MYLLNINDSRARAEKLLLPIAKHWMYTIVGWIACKKLTIRRSCILMLLLFFSRIFQSCRDVTISVMSCKFRRAGRLRPLSSESSLDVPHRLWHGSSVYYGLLRGPMTLTPVAKRLAVELSLPVLTTLTADIRTPNLLRGMRGECSITDCATAAMRLLCEWLIWPCISFETDVNFYIVSLEPSSQTTSKMYDPLPVLAV